MVQFYGAIHAVGGKSSNRIDTISLSLFSVQHAYQLVAGIHLLQEPQTWFYCRLRWFVPTYGLACRKGLQALRLGSHTSLADGSLCCTICPQQAQYFRGVDVRYCVRKTVYDLQRSLLADFYPHELHR